MSQSSSQEKRLQNLLGLLQKCLDEFTLKKTELMQRFKEIAQHDEMVRNASTSSTGSDNDEEDSHIGDQREQERRNDNTDGDLTEASKKGPTTEDAPNINSSLSSPEDSNIAEASTRESSQRSDLSGNLGEPTRKGTTTEDATNSTYRLPRPEDSNIDEARSEKSLSGNLAEASNTDGGTSDSANDDSSPSSKAFVQVRAVRSKVSRLALDVKSFTGKRDDRLYKSLQTELALCEVELDQIDTEGIDALRKERRSVALDLHRAVSDLERKG